MANNIHQKNANTSNIVVHADRVELLIPASYSNCDVLSTRFHDLIEHWKTTYGLVSRAKKRLDGTGKLVFWELELHNDNTRITLEDCPGLHLQDTGKPLKQEPDWVKHPFPTHDQLYTDYADICLNYMGVVRFTCVDKSDPHKHTTYLWKLLTDLETWGIQHKTRLLEISMDIYDRELACRLQQTARLSAHKSPLDLGHWNGGISDGPSCNGSNEYEHCRGFLRDRTRQLHTYDRWDCGGFYRIELRLGQVYLHRYYGSSAFYNDLLKSGGRHRASPQAYIGTDRTQPSVASPTLALLDAIPALIRRHLVFESTDTEKLTRDHPRLATVHLDKLSIRGIRYYLDRAGIPAKPYSRRLLFPEFQSITPADLEALNLETGLNKRDIETKIDHEVDQNGENSTDTYTPKEIIPCPEPFLLKRASLLEFGRHPRARSP